AVGGGVTRPASTEWNGIDWRSIDALPGRIDVGKALPPYPAPTVPAGSPAGTGGRFDVDPVGVVAGTTLKQFQTAQTARQQLADQIYRRLLAVTGVPPIPAAQAATPS